MSRTSFDLINSLTQFVAALLAIMVAILSFAEKKKPVGIGKEKKVFPATLNIGQFA